MASVAPESTLAETVEEGVSCAGAGSGVTTATGVAGFGISGLGLVICLGFRVWGLEFTATAVSGFPNSCTTTMEFPSKPLTIAVPTSV